MVEVATGRPRDEAPEGYVTVREAADLLGLSQSAIRNRIRKDTLEAMDEATDGGEPRYYIPIDAIRSEVERSEDVATIADVEDAGAVIEGKVEKNRELVERLGSEIIGAIHKVGTDVGTEVSMQRVDVVGALDRLSRELSTLNRHLDEQAKDAAKDREALRLYLERGAERSEPKAQGKVSWWRRLLDPPNSSEG